MYKIIRRISSSFFPRPDRPWSEDATSNAPQIGRKRRAEPELEEREGTPSKKHRAESESESESESVSVPEQEQLPESSAVQEKETEEVKEVTKGVREVELEDGEPSLPAAEETETSAEAAAAVPLPDSPVLKATEGVDDEDQDAGGELDVEAKQEDEVEETAEVASSGKEDSPPADSAAPGPSPANDSSKTAES